MQRLPLLLALCACARAVLPPDAPTLRFGTLSAYCGLQEIYTVLEDTALDFATSYIRERGGIVRSHSRCRNARVKIPGHR